MEFQQYINEGGYSRLMRTMSGLVPSIKTFAIITWENPMGIKANDKFNKEANKRLKDTLKRGNYSFRHIKGKYNDFENPFMILNITLKESKQLGFEHKEYKQDSIIFGKRVKKDGSKVGVNIKMIYSDDNRKPDVRRIWKYLDKDTDNFYSEYKGRKFEIPLFDDEAKHFTFKNGNKEVIEHNVYRKEQFSSNSNIDKLNELRDIILDENRSGRFLYEHRGILKKSLLQYVGTI